MPGLAVQILLRDPEPGSFYSPALRKDALQAAFGIRPYDRNYYLDNHFGTFGADGIILQFTSSWTEIEILYLGSHLTSRGRLLARDH